MCVRVHIPVLLDFICEKILQATDKYVIDATLGEGGHSLHLAQRGLNVIAFERDDRILQVAKNTLQSYNKQTHFYRMNYRDMDKVIEQNVPMKTKQVNLALFDLGISRFHYERSGGGFGFKVDEPLDMRLEPQAGTISAKDVVNSYSTEELADIFWRYGEEKRSFKIARLLVAKRQLKPFNTTTQLANCVSARFPNKPGIKKHHPATQVFQALRIYVNNELQHIKAGLQAALSCLAPEGRLVVISYHSLEDREVKFFFNSHVAKSQKHNKYREKQPSSPYKLGTKKPITPTEEEIINNRSARSAKLRLLIKQ